MTPPERIYRELGNFASRQESLLHPSKAEQDSRISKTPDENEVVEMIKNWRVGENTHDHNDTSENKGKQVLKKDNVAPEEVVEIIKDYRTNKIKYVQYQESTTDREEHLMKKLDEVKEIFNQTSNKMEWEKINSATFSVFGEQMGLTEWAEIKKMALEPNNFFRLGHQIISLAERSKIFQEYTTLNDNFKQRLENENRHQDEKKTGEKRPMLESPKKEEEPSDSDYAEFDEENSIPEECWTTNYQTVHLQEIQLMMFDEVKEEETTEATASPSSTKSGKDKKKKKNNNKK
ncbi:hypothetical protein GLOIN_2v1486559 [Rhizophagus irregularis DAOM 181602=DAOM 197198]|uniref:Uncharacterized protein n=1 Tax=Rhizophagus irregularis (strain DAOM 181602 / DAOM 197198 / MUCL 43194) TaxID=747089 RepID=A0A2P4P6Q5_RHIID|nr:hypothetical protein GLOIN_2v1486559 [Rhizophagus irregularis DAOM 181602=DAOM 197198]POG61064.1 hypothetical protein GLOIN_2v1486559 [Rhizophagus irregularis DAOM 181602=DAOM 197198]|eukprot:XP_025167930.1 hypothetical protein GLOIN_2v1486559 [Rhizophagus irregularis DAOM 181602=DAOM 197198]